MTPDEQRHSDAIADAEWRAYNESRARTADRLRALGLVGETLQELADAAADRLERLGALGRIGG